MQLFCDPQTIKGLKNHRFIATLLVPSLHITYSLIHLHLTKFQQKCILPWSTLVILFRSINTLQMQSKDMCLHYALKHLTGNYFDN